jgi:broad specificity phosphatase PhoE
MIMRPIVLICLIFFCLASSAKTIYLVRHAEKADDGTKNPVLTAQGQQRAENIAAMLSSAGITQVFATDYQRTQLTAKPLAEYLDIPVTTYDPRDLTSFAQHIKKLPDNALVVGHSNTTPELTHLLSGEPVIKLSEKDFDYVFQVIIDGPHRTLTVLKSLPHQESKLPTEYFND